LGETWASGAVVKTRAKCDRTGRFSARNRLEQRASAAARPGKASFGKKTTRQLDFALLVLLLGKGRCELKKSLAGKLE